MADVNDLAEINNIYDELRYVLTVLRDLDAGTSRISSFILLLADGRTIGVDAAGFSYPPQMIQSIRQQFEDRHAALVQQLADLGITGEPSLPPVEAPAPTTTPVRFPRPQA